MTQIISNFAEISNRYDAAFVDLWGCMHNGVAAFPEAIAAMQDFRARGGRVVFVTNAPRGRDPVERHLAKLGIPDDAWDTIATSGDSARAAMFRGAVGQNVYFIGQDHDQNFFDPLKIETDPVEISRVLLEEADGIVCCGPEDPFADPAKYMPQFLYAKQKGLKLLCANPDIVVDRGERREWCAGALARLYTEMGGESLYFGKPHPPIYDLARRRLFALPGAHRDPRIICIGDGLITDVQGAMGEDLDCLFISGGLAAEETGTINGTPNSAKLSKVLQDAQMSPLYAIGHLR